MFIKLFLITIVVFLLIDIFWLGVVAKNIYAKEIGRLMKRNVNWLAAFIFYGIFIAGLVFFVIGPSVEDESILTAVLSGAIFGFVTYSTYDLTNLSVLKGWSLKITVIDILWGTFLASSVSVLTYIIAVNFII